MPCCCFPGLEIIYEATQPPRANSDPMMIAYFFAKKISFVLCRSSDIYNSSAITQLNTQSWDKMIPWPCVKGFSFSMEWSLTLDKNGAPNVLFVKRTCIFGCLYPMLLLWFLQPEPITGESKKKWREQMQREYSGPYLRVGIRRCSCLYDCKKQWSLKRESSFCLVLDKIKEEVSAWIAAGARP